MDQNQTGIIIQLLRGLDNGMPDAVRPVWNKMTPDFQRQKAQEAQMQALRQQELQQGGSEVAPEQAELEQYRRSRQ